VVTRALLATALVACSSKRPPRVDDAATVAPARDATPAPDAAAGSGSAGSSGEVAIRIEWKNVPTAMRASPGRTSCNTPRAAAVAPTTTWGIPDVLVIVEGAPAVTHEARITLADCALAPRLAIGTSFVVESAVDRPAKLALARRGDVTKLPVITDGAPRAIQLPIAGHAVTLPVEPDGIYQLATDGKDPELAWLVVASGAITDASGLATIRNVPLGAHAVTAWLPPRGGQPARKATGKVTVVANELAELTLELVP
jgi:hypothetical protein